MNMRILYLSPYLPHFSSAVGETSRQIVREMRKAGVDVVTFPSDTGEAASSSTQFKKRRLFYQLRRFSTRWLPSSVSMFLLEGFLLVRGVLRSILWGVRIWRARQELRPDVVLGRALEYDLTPAIAARVLRCPLVLETHSAFHLEREYRGMGRSRLVKWLDQFVWKSADRLWVVSRVLGKIITSNGVDSRRIKPISIGVSKDQFTPKPAGQNNAVTSIVFVGSFHPWHGVTTLLTAFAEVLARGVSAKLILIGDGITRAENQLQAESLDISNFVEFTGWLPLDEVSERLKTVDIAAAPFDRLDYFYHAPVKILEYMTASLPVIASAQGEIPTMLEDGLCGILIPPGEVAPLVDAIVRLTQDVNLCRSIGMAARRRIEEHYDWSHTIIPVIALCCEAVTEHATTPTS